MRRGQRTAHRAMSYGLAAVLALILISALALRPDYAGAPAPERLDAGGEGAAQ